MRANWNFIATLWISLIAVWSLSGEQFLDLVFAMPNLGPVDDVILTGVVWLEEARVAIGLPDLFQLLRDALHRLSGLG